jgi:hypothetical protein
LTFPAISLPIIYEAPKAANDNEMVWPPTHSPQACTPAAERAARGGFFNCVRCVI